VSAYLKRELASKTERNAFLVRASDDHVCLYAVAGVEILSLNPSLPLLYVLFTLTAGLLFRQAGVLLIAEALKLQTGISLIELLGLLFHLDRPVHVLSISI
jgi:hypothetical protein